MTRTQMNWKIIRSLIPIIGLWIITKSTKNITKEYEHTDPVLKIFAKDLAWRFQVNEGNHLIGKTVEISGITTSIDSIYVYLDKRVFFSKNLIPMESIIINKPIKIIARCANFKKKGGVLKVDHVNLISKQDSIRF